MKPNRQTVNLSWGHVSYLEWGKPQGKPFSVILLHGAGLDSANLSWGPLGDALSDVGYHVIAPDHPGYGETPSPPWKVTQERLVTYVGEFIDAVGVESYVIGGLSLGGGLTLGHLLTQPAGVRAGMLFGSYGLMEQLYTGPFARFGHLLAWATVRSGLQHALTGAYVNRPQLMRSSMGNLIRNSSQITDELVADIVAAGQRPHATAAYAEWQLDQVSSKRLRTNYLNQLEDIHVPVLLIHGERDPGVPVTYAYQAAERLPRSELHVIPDAAHWVQRDRPDLVTPIVEQFLARLN